MSTLHWTQCDTVLWDIAVVHKFNSEKAVFDKNEEFTLAEELLLRPAYELKFCKCVRFDLIFFLSHCCAIHLKKWSYTMCLTENGALEVAFRI